MGVVHDHGIGIGHVEARLDDHRAHEDVEVARDEALHHVLEGCRRHLSMGHAHARARRERAHPGRDGLDRLHPVVDEEHLAAAIELAGDGLLEQPVVPRFHESEDRRAVARRRLDEREVTQAGE